MFEADTVLADGYKYLAIVTSSYEGRASIKNLSIQTATMNGLMPSKYGDELMISMEDGEFVTVMGPSGSGKSTLLYTVSGMDNATAGEVIFNGKDLSKLNKKEIMHSFFIMYIC